jgi:hypothetical protein
MSSPTALRLALPAGQGKVFARQGLIILALFIFIIWMGFRDTFGLVPHLVIALLVQQSLERFRVLRTPPYTLD